MTTPRRSPHTGTRALADALAQQAEQAGADSSRVRGADWRQAIVATVNSGGTIITTDGITARRLEIYRNPLVGDVIIVTQSSSGNWLAVGRTTADSDGLGTVLSKRKTADTGPRTSATPSADPHLSVTLAANATYILDAFIKWSGDSAGDMNWGWAIPSGTAGSYVAYAPDTATTATPNTVRIIDTAMSGTRSFGTFATVIGIIMRGTVRTAGTAGTLAANWSAFTAGGTGATVYTDSWIRLERVS